MRIKGLVIWCCFIFTLSIFQSCDSTDPLLEISQSENPKLSKYFENRDQYEIQIVYTQIDRDENNVAEFTTYKYNYDSLRYFYPASSIKMPVAFLALQKLNELNIDRKSIMLTDSSRAPQSAAKTDTTHVSGFPSAEHYIEKLFVVSDNDAYNRLYEFVGQDYINKELKEKGIFSNSRIVTRVGISGFTPEDNRHTNPVEFQDTEGNSSYKQPAVSANGNYYTELNDTQKGLGYYDEDLDAVVNTPFDMSQKNFLNLVDLESSLKRILFSENYSAKEKLNLAEDDYKFLFKTMQKLPKDFEYLREQDYNYYDSYVKFFLVGDDEEPMPENIKIFNKVGYAYGYLTDCSYIIDLRNKVEFFLTATIHVNENQIYNDGKYEYDDGIAFLAELGRQVYNLEAKREKKHQPDFEKFLFD